MITYEEALARIRQVVRPLPVEEAPLDRLLGRSLAEAALTLCDLPPFDNSAVDGYGLTRSDLEAAAEPCLPCTIVSAAGSWPDRALRPGECAQILTGAPIPPGVAAVAMQEDVRQEGDHIVFPTRPPVGAHIRRQGEEFRRGDIVLEAGHRCGPASIAALASAGRSTARVRRLPRIGVLITGDELVQPGSPLSAGRIYESTSYGVLAALSSLGLGDVPVRRVRDDLEATRAAFADLLESCDVVISTGGVSVGRYDNVKEALRTTGVEEVFWGVAIKPGKPVFFGRKDERLVFGLPGNPMSVMVTLFAFALPALRGLAGLPVELERPSSAELANGFERKAGRMEFVPSNADGGRVVPIMGQGSHMLGGLAKADCLMIVPRDAQRLSAGDTVQIAPLRWSL